MKDLFFAGGALFMGILSILLVIMVAWFIYHLILFFNSQQISQENAFRKLGHGKAIGLFAMIFWDFGAINWDLPGIFCYSRSRGHIPKVSLCRHKSINDLNALWDIHLSFIDTIMVCNKLYYGKKIS